jgi:hypothetical protein
MFKFKFHGCRLRNSFCWPLQNIINFNSETKSNFLKKQIYFKIKIEYNLKKNKIQLTKNIKNKKVFLKIYLLAQIEILFCIINIDISLLFELVFLKNKF